MRDEALTLAGLQPGMQVIDVGSGTGFTTEGIVQSVAAGQVTCIDQSPHQMKRAQKKPLLKSCNFILGDAENLPAPTDHFDRYVSAGSIEYWPDPQRGICEAFRVIKPGGIAVMIGPLPPQNVLMRFLADAWMLFPEESAYRHWFRAAGFEDITVRYVQPHWHKGRGRYGLAIAGRKPHSGPSKLSHGSAEKKISTGKSLSFQSALRLILGSLAGFLFIPIALVGYLFSIGSQRGVPPEYRERLNIYQIVVLGILLLLIVGGIIWIL